jgi:TPR repeat protein
LTERGFLRRAAASLPTQEPDIGLGRRRRSAWFSARDDWMMKPMPRWWRVLAGVLLAGLTACGRDDEARLAQGNHAMEAGHYAQAYCLWRPLADHGNAEAQYRIGWMFANGQGMELDEAEALRWWESAASGGHLDAQFAVAQAYLMGTGVASDPERAVSWLIKAADQDDADALELLLDLAGRDVAPAVAWLQRWLDGRRWRTLASIRRVKADRANVRAAIGTDKDLVATLEQGSEVLQLGAQQDWLRIAIPEQKMLGWIYAPLVEDPQQ